MFAPIGFLPFSEFTQEIDKALVSFPGFFKEVLTDNVRPSLALNILTSAIDGETTDTKDIAKTVLAKRYLIDAILWRQASPVYLASPFGQVTRIDRRIFIGLHNPSDLSFAQYFNALNDRLGAFAGLMDEVDSENHPYVFIQPKTYVIKALSDKEAALFANEFSPDFEDLLPIVQQFDGWSICLKDEDVPHLLERLQADLNDPNDETPTTAQIGRPKQRNRAASIYFDLYAQGHSNLGLTWKQALAEVNARLPRPVDLQTLRRGIEERTE